MLCTRWEVSIAGTCEIGLTELTEDDGAGPITKLYGGVLVGIRGRGDCCEDIDLYAAGAWKSAVRRQGDTCAPYDGGHYRASGAKCRGERACMKLQ